MSVVTKLKKVAAQKAKAKKAAQPAPKPVQAALKPKVAQGVMGARNQQSATPLKTVRKGVRDFKVVEERKAMGATIRTLEPVTATAHRQMMEESGLSGRGGIMADNAIIPLAVREALTTAIQYFHSLQKKAVPENLVPYEEVPTLIEPGADDFQACAHERALINEVIYLLEKRKDELKDSLAAAMMMSGMEEVGVSGLRAEVVHSHTSRMDRVLGAAAGVSAAQFEAMTVREDYSYVKLTDPDRPQGRR